MFDIDISKLSTNETKELLQRWREDNVRCPEKVLEMWHKLVSNCNLKDEKWAIIEQVYMAALDLHDDFLLESFLSELESEFPRSVRVKLLKVMAKLDLKELYGEALKFYSDLIKKDNTNSLFCKRKIAILQAQGKTSEAVKDLTEYLKKFINDTEAWSELCDIYIQEQEYLKAAFCMEELILTNPHNYIYFLKYAEIQYTINTLESLELARSYFTQAHKLNPENIRALYGLMLSYNGLLRATKSNSKQQEYKKVINLINKKISDLYDASKDEKCGYIDLALNFEKMTIID